MDKDGENGENGENGEARPNEHPSISEVINKLGAAYNKLKEQTVKVAAAVNTKTEVCIMQ
jgi:hypothetical protein